MDAKNCADLSNSELKIYMMTLDEEFEAKKSLVKKICEEMDSIERQYKKAEQELNMRKNMFF